MNKNTNDDRNSKSCDENKSNSKLTAQTDTAVQSADLTMQGNLSEYAKNSAEGKEIKVSAEGELAATAEEDNSQKLSAKENAIQIIKFVCFSASAGVIQMLSFTLMNELIKWSYWPSYLIALTLSVLWNFTINRRLTFKSATNVPIAMLKVFAYYVVFTPLSTWWGEALTAIGWNEYVVLFGTMIINMATEYLVCRFFVYRNSINTNDIAKKDKK